MNDKIVMSKSYCDKVKKFMNKFSTEELMDWRNKLIELGMLDNDLLMLFNEELLDRACERIEIKQKNGK